MRKFLFLSVVFSLFQTASLFAQTDESVSDEAPMPTIFETVTDNSDNSKGYVILSQDERIKDLVLRKKQKDLKNRSLATTQGFRVQVYSSNQQKTAKVEAYKIEENINEHFPDIPVYVSYISPFWKVRVGDCLSNNEAQSLRADLIKIFPQYQKETYIVKDKIFIPE